jgi:hypothetical protein
MTSSNSLDENKRFAKVIRKALPFPVADVPEEKPQASLPFTTEAKYFRRIRRGHNITIERCKDIMESFYPAKTVSKAQLENMVAQCVGMDYRTIKRYVGFSIYSRGKGGDPDRFVKHIQGYLERLYYIQEAEKPNVFVLNHNLVERDYHVENRVLSSINEESIPKVSIDKMCVCSDREASERGEAKENDVRHTSTTTNNNNTTHTQISRVKVRHSPYASEHIADGEGVLKDG